MSWLLNNLSEQRLADYMRSNNSTVYGVVLNDQQSVSLLAPELTQPPYKAPPIAPILYIKPANTFTASGLSIELPSGETSVAVGATLALIIKQDLAKAAVEQANQHVGALALVADLSLPHTSYYRPAIREKCFDGALPIADDSFTLDDLSAIEELVIETRINQQLVDSKVLTDLVRSPAQLLSDVTDYMSLSCGDGLLLGVSYQAPIAKVGDTVNVSIKGISQLSFNIKAGVDA